MEEKPKFLLCVFFSCFFTFYFLTITYQKKELRYLYREDFSFISTPPSKQHSTPLIKKKKKMYSKILHFLYIFKFLRYKVEVTAYLDSAAGVAGAAAAGAGDPGAAAL